MEILQYPNACLLIQKKKILNILQSIIITYSDVTRHHLCSMMIFRSIPVERAIVIHNGILRRRDVRSVLIVAGPWRQRRKNDNKDYELLLSCIRTGFKRCSTVCRLRNNNIIILLVLSRHEIALIETYGWYTHL